MAIQDVHPPIDASAENARRPSDAGQPSTLGPRGRDCCWVNAAAAECYCDADGRAEGLGMAVGDVFGRRHWLSAVIVFTALLALGVALLAL